MAKLILSQDHTARKRENQGSNPGTLVPEACALNRHMIMPQSNSPL